MKKGIPVRLFGLALVCVCLFGCASSPSSKTIELRSTLGEQLLFCLGERREGLFWRPAPRAIRADTVAAGVEVKYAYPYGEFTLNLPEGAEITKLFSSPEWLFLYAKVDGRYAYIALLTPSDNRFLYEYYTDWRQNGTFSVEALAKSFPSDYAMMESVLNTVPREEPPEGRDEEQWTSVVGEAQ